MVWPNLPIMFTKHTQKLLLCKKTITLNYDIKCVLCINSFPLMAPSQNQQTLNFCMAPWVLCEQLLFMIATGYSPEQWRLLFVTVQCGDRVISNQGMLGSPRLTDISLPSLSCPSKTPIHFLTRKPLPYSEITTCIMFYNFTSLIWPLNQSCHLSSHVFYFSCCVHWLKFQFKKKKFVSAFQTLITEQLFRSETVMSAVKTALAID